MSHQYTSVTECMVPRLLFYLGGVHIGTWVVYNYDYCYYCLLDCLGVHIGTWVVYNYDYCYYCLLDCLYFILL